MNENGLDRPILIVGAPRSGKSLITNVFRSAEEFCLVNEPLSIWNLGWRSGDDDCRSEGEVTPRIQQQIVAACLDQLKRNGRRRYLDNLAYHALRVGFVAKVLPNAGLIFVTRNASTAIPEMVKGWTTKTSIIGTARNTRKSVNWRTFPRLASRFALNYAASRIKGRRSTWGPTVPGLREFARGHSIPETVAFQWCELNRLALEGLRELPEGRWIQVRFEDLIDRPQQEFARIARFAEVDSPDAMAEHAAGFVNPADIPEYSQWSPAEISQGDWDRIRPLVAQTQQDLGYETTPGRDQT